MHLLTKKQRDVLAMLSDGADDLDVCRALGLDLDGLNEILEEIRVAVAARPTHHALVARFERGLRTRAERRATAIGSRFSALIEASPLAVFIVDGATGFIKQTNEYAARLFGYSVAELVGRSVEDLVSQDFRAKHVQYRSAFLASVRRREMGYHPPIFAMRKDGSRFEVSIALTATAFDNEVMVVCTDFIPSSRAAANVKSRVSEG